MTIARLAKASARAVARPPSIGLDFGAVSSLCNKRTIKQKLITTINRQMQSYVLNKNIEVHFKENKKRKIWHREK